MTINKATLILDSYADGSTPKNDVALALVAKALSTVYAAANSIKGEGTK